MPAAFTSPDENHFYLAIGPVDGWYIASETGEVGLPPRAIEYVAVRGSESQRLGVSRFHFFPTEARFAWLVRNRFPSSMVRPGGGISPLWDTDVDELIAGAGHSISAAGVVRLDVVGVAA
jgi:hypothetical protein